MSIFRNDTLGSWTRGGQAIVHNLRMTTQVLFQTGIATLVIWVIGTLWYALEKSSAYERFVLTKIIEASFKADAALGTNDPVLFKTPSGEHYWTSADWLLASDLAKKTLHNFEVILIHGALISGLFALGALFWAWYYFTRTGKGLGSNEYLRGARFGTLRQIKRALWRQKKGSLVIGGVPVPRAFEPEHVLLCGAPGTGKTNLIVKMLDGIRKEGKRAIVYDTAGTFVEKFYRQGIDTLLNPLDARTARWSPWVDVPRDYHYDQIAESTIPDKSGDPFWAKAARGTLVAVLRKLAKQKHTFVSVLLDRLLRSKLKDLAAFVSGTDAAAFISTEGERTSASIQAELASVMRSFAYGITASHVLVLDEAGQLGNRQALRMLEISRKTGARLILLGDDKQTGAIEQGKPFWLMQKLGMSTAQLTESMRQQTRTMKAAVTQARVGNYSGSLASLDKVVSGVDAEKLAEMLVAEWTRLKPENRANTNILVLENATRLIVNTQIRETLKREGVVAAEDTRLQVLTPTGMTDQEKHNARFYSGGQVVTFGRDMVGLGIARATEYRVLGIGRDANGRQIVRLVDEHGRIISWDPRLGKARQINVFNQEERNLAQGDRIQWRLVHKDLDLKNAERGTVERLDGAIATIRWDRDNREQRVDLATHKTWDHGYAETVYSAQSKTYDRAYVLAPVDSGLVNGQNYYTAITRARYGVKLWTEDPQRLAQKLEQRSGEKTSALEGLGRLERDTLTGLAGRHGGRLRQSREEQERLRREHRDRSIQRQLDNRERTPSGLGERLADNARSVAEILDRFLQSVLDRSPIPDRQPDRDDPTREDRAAVVASHVHEPSHDHDH